MDDPDPQPSPNARDPVGVRRFLSRRMIWHTLGLVIALALAWLILRAYRQPEFMIDLLSLRLC